MGTYSPEHLIRWYEQEAIRAERKAAATPIPSARERWLRAAAAYRIDAESCRLARAELTAERRC